MALLPRLWIDADACPREVRDIACRAALRGRVRVSMVSNGWLSIPGSPNIDFTQVKAGSDKADDHIVEQAQSTDLTVTADIPLAGRLVEKGLTAVNPRGEEYTAANIGERLATRDLMETLRGAGLVTGGPPPFCQRDAQRFANALDRYLTKWHASNPATTG